VSPAELRGIVLERDAIKAPYGPWKTMTFIAGRRLDRISAPWIIDRPINGELFTIYVERVLAPRCLPGSSRQLPTSLD
jgi:hypothetical protein